MTMYYRNDEEEGGGGGKARPSLDYLRERTGGSNTAGLTQPLAEVRCLVIIVDSCLARKMKV